MAHETDAFAFELLTKTVPLLLFDPAVSLFKRLPELDQHYVLRLKNSQRSVILGVLSFLEGTISFFSAARVRHTRCVPFGVEAARPRDGMAGQHTRSHHTSAFVVGIFSGIERIGFSN